MPVVADPQHKIAMLEERVANLTMMLDMMKIQLIQNAARIASLEECECHRKCLYKGIERSHNGSWIQDVCTTCSCHDGHVMCTAVADNPLCLGGCWVNNTLHGNNETIQIDSCTSCVCRMGEVKCETLQCPDLLCRHTITVPGQCCSQCLSCTERGRVMPYGSAYRPNACTRCQCEDNAPSPTCIIQSCPNISCIGTPVQLPKACCPVCKDCPPHGNREIWAIGNRRNCTCEEGEQRCVDELCPQVHCQHPVKARCCPTCAEGCFYNGSLYFHNQKFDIDTCTHCECQGGSVTCETDVCPQLTCTKKFKQDDHCCAECPVCEAGDQRIGHNQLVMINACRRCLCFNGEWTNCQSRNCRPLGCRVEAQYRPAGRCCNVCRRCDYEGRQFNHGEVIIPRNDICARCSCLNAEVTCTAVICSQTCWHPAPSFRHPCCQNCTACMFKSLVYENGAVFEDHDDHCTECTCLDGNVTCLQKKCPKLSCQDVIHPESSCCSVCAPKKCEIEGQIVNHGVAVQLQGSPCSLCLCEDGLVSCQNAICSVPCSHPLPPPVGQCCSNCTDGCLYKGRNYTSNSEFHVDDCTICRCQRGSVQCITETCPPVSCRMVQKVYGECCPVCQYCMYEDKQYEDGDTFLDPSDPCYNCTCLTTSVLCNHTTCPNCTHPTPKSEGTCCHDCRNCLERGRLIPNGRTFRPNVCTRCTCRDGSVHCNVQSCPPVTCKKTKAVLNQCCPVCQVCFYNGHVYDDGDLFASVDNPCEVCECKGTETLCHHINCVTCTHPVMPRHGDCCSNCSVCELEGIIYGDLAKFMHPSDPCLSCVCQGGNVSCTRQECADLSCRVSVVPPRQCCPVCQACHHGGVIREHEEAWVADDDPCLSFECMDGVISHYLLRCADDCNRSLIQVPGQCCPICPPDDGDGCKHDNQHYEVGQQFFLNDNPCVQCFCEEKGHRCYSKPCPVRSCFGEMLKFEGQCCSLCIDLFPPTEITAVSPVQPVLGQCRFNNNVYNLRERVGAYNDSCYNCTCQELDNSARDDAQYLNRISPFGASSGQGQVVCEIQTCPTLPCPADQHVTVSGKCCKVCKFKPCFRNGIEHQHDANISHDQFGCTTCICRDGELADCLHTPCPALTCPIGTDLKLLEGECCVECSVMPSCKFDGRTHQHGEQWRSRCRNYACFNGVVNFTEQACLPLRCKQNEVPDRKPSECCSKCVPRPATCMAFGDPHYNTFDGQLHHFQGVCNYILAQDCTNGDFSVLVENDDRGYQGVSWTQEATFNRGNVSIDFIQGTTIRANGRPVNLPYVIAPYVHVTQEDRHVVLRSDVGVTVTWDGNSILSVNIPYKYANSMCGLCGNYNGNQFDEFRLRDGRITKDVNEFGNSWQVRRPGDKCEPKRGGPEPCQQRPKSHRDLARSTCSELLGDAFKPCRGVVNHADYFYSCMFDVCACARSETQCLCSALEAYANECARRDVQLRGRWRTGECAIRCPSERGLVYDECGNPCRKTCDNYHQQIRCLQPCVASCQCLAGMVEHNGYCVPPSSCPRL